MNKIFALVDCNNFYVNCERLFRPDLKNRPVVVLSNNDGCIVSRSQEARALGIQNGRPHYQIKHLIRQHDIAVFSSNYTLYGDLSFRVMQTLESLAPQVEVYSIDEAFLDLTGVSHFDSLEAYGQHIKAIVEKHVGIPVCVGIGPTKTLAKLANHAAKIYPATRGVVDLSDPARQQRLRKITPTAEVWGVGRRLNQQLALQGIKTAEQLAHLQPKLARKQYSVVLERTIRELNGESCINLEDEAPSRQQIICSRSFRPKITRLPDLRQAIARYTARAAEKLREQQLYSKMITLFIMTSPHKSDTPQYARSVSSQLRYPSADTRDFNQRAQALLEQVWRDGYQYYKGGVILTDFCSRGTMQYDLFDEEKPRPRSDELMAVMDRINKKSRSRLIFAGQGISSQWQTRRELLSPAYTTRWQDIPRVR